MIKKLGDLIGASMTGVILSRIQIKDTDIVDEKDIDTVRVLMPKAIVNGSINQSDIPDITVKRGSGQSRMTEVGDVVVKLTTPYDSAMVTQQEEDLLVPSYCAVFRDIDEKIVDLGYLVAYLNTDYAKKLLTAGAAASTTSMLKVRDILAIDVPLPPLDEQKMLGGLYSLSREKQSILTQMLANEAAVMDNLIGSAIMEVMKDV